VVTSALTTPVNTVFPAIKLVADQMRTVARLDRRLHTLGARPGVFVSLGVLTCTTT
jgi:hypothetical protein